MQIYSMSRGLIETSALPGASAVICMADSRDQLATILDASNVAARLDLIFNDAPDAFGLVHPPTIDDARKILAFVDENMDLPHLVLQCQVGIGRSHAVHAAFMKIHGMNPRRVLHAGTYNRRLYQLMLQAANVAPDPEPLASMCVRVKYAPDRLRLFLLSMRRQRYENWEVVAVTDGPNEAAARVVERLADPRVRLIQTEKALGRWGHPYRQLGIDHCRGDFIGLSNDDNYYVPGYFEQMHYALQDADLATCFLVHNYMSYSVVESGSDLGSWMARTELVRQVPWPGTDFLSDQHYIEALRKLAGSRVVDLPRPLFVHN